MSIRPQPDQDCSEKLKDGFPGPTSLCEECGYRLLGLELNQICPECGNVVSQSSPLLRPGMPWQRRIGLWPWLSTVLCLLFRPGNSFRKLRIGGSNLPDRLFLATFVFGLSGMVLLDYWLENVYRPWLWAVIVVTGIPAATYIEILGVTFFSGQKGWRLPFELAERVACYASVGWTPAVVALSQIQLLVEKGYLERWWNPNWGPYTLAIDFTLSMALMTVSILWFEILVWIGVRKVRYANAPVFDPT